jgi:hypothetical protein
VQIPTATASSPHTGARIQEFSLAEFDFDAILKRTDELHPLIHPKQLVFADFHAAFPPSHDCAKMLPGFIA